MKVNRETMQGRMTLGHDAWVPMLSVGVSGVRNHQAKWKLWGLDLRGHTKNSTVCELRHGRLQKLLPNTVNEQLPRRSKTLETNIKVGRVNGVHYGRNLC